MAGIILNDISLRYSRQWTLLQVSAELAEAKATLITGDNGAGKTTLLRIIATALRPTRGAVEIFGRDAFEEREFVRSQLGMISHNSHLYYDLSAIENLELVSEFSGLGSTRADHLAALDRVGLGDAANQVVRSYSAGMKRRIMIARLLMRKPRLVIFDEPFGQLDPGGVQLMTEVFLGLKNAGCTILLATHLHQLGRSLCDYEMSLKDGRLLDAPALISSHQGEGL